jgi:hypothetical protein
MLRLNLYSQSRWSNIYYPSENAYGLNIGLSYDKGYIIVGKHGSNAVEFNWLIKTDINGEILWEKTLGSSSHIFQINDMAYNDFGDLYLIGLTDSYNNDNYDPLIMKLNSCGEKQWCRVFMQNDNNFSNVLRVTSDNGVAIACCCGRRWLYSSRLLNYLMNVTCSQLLVKALLSLYHLLIKRTS